MQYIFLHKAYSLEKNRVDPDDIRTINPIELEDGAGSLVTFKGDDLPIQYVETPQEIKWKERQMRYLWPNVERIIMGILGGVIGALITHVFKK